MLNKKFHKKFFLFVCSFLMYSTLLVYSSHSVKANEDITVTTACEDVTLFYHEKNSNTKEVTFRVTGTPGNMVSLHINEYLGDWVTSKYITLPSNGVIYTTFKVPNGSYLLTVVQESPCSGSLKPFFFTMN